MGNILCQCKAIECSRMGKEWICFLDTQMFTLFIHLTCAFVEFFMHMYVLTDLTSNDDNRFLFCVSVLYNLQLSISTGL